MNLFTELKRRNVFRVGAAYVVTAWLLLQAGDILLGNFDAPGWVFKSLAALLSLGFPIVLVFAWAYEITPEGIRRERGVASEPPITPVTGRRLDQITIVMIVLALGVLAVDRLWLARPTPAAATAAPAPIVDQSIAVLPFADLSPAGDQEYFADGIAEELLNALARVEGLRVAGRTSSFHYRGRDEDLRSIGETLGVAYLLEGSVRKSAERIRITAQLVSAGDGFHVWSETYNGDVGDIFDLQERIARAITTELKVVLRGDQRERIMEITTENPEAYGLYLQATSIFNRRDRDRLVHATGLLEEALRLDPDFTRARARLAAVLLVAPSYAPVDQDEFSSAAEREARIAIGQNDRLAEPHAVLGLLYSSNRQYPAAHAEFLRALELEPNDVTSNFWFAIHLWMAGYLDQAGQRLDRVLGIDPLLPIALNWRALGYLNHGDLQTADTFYQRAFDLGLAAAEQGLSYVAELRGDRDLAEKMFARVVGGAFAIPGGPDAAETLSAGIYGGSEERRKAIDLMDDHLASGPERIHGIVLNVLMRLGEHDRALELATNVPLINNTLFMAPLWVRPLGDAAVQSSYFSEFARRTGLADYWDRYGAPDRCRRQADEDYVCE